ncbi:MAG: tetratricopeptide repeat protein [bacterium]
MKKAKTDSFDRFYNYSWIVVFFLPFAIYITSLSLGFVYFDDDVLVLENLKILKDPSNVGTFFTTDVFLGHAVPYYRPMLNVALAAGAAMGGADPKAYHLVSLLVHCFTVMSLLWLLGLLGFTRSKSLIGALLFSLHPLMANAIFWIPALNDTLVTLFSLFSFACFIRFIREKSLKFLLLHLLSLAGAFFSKESAVALPLLFLGYMFVSKQRFFGRQKAMMYAGWVAIVVAWFFLRQSSIGALQGDEQGLGAIMKNLPFLPEIVAGFFLPFNLAVMPVFSVFYTLAGLILIALLIMWALVNKKRNSPMLFLGLFWFLAFAAPNMFIRLFNTADSFDYLPHRAYLPSIGLLLIILALAPDAWTDLKTRATRIIFLLLMIVLALFSLLQERKYRDGEAFWSSVIKVSPDRAWFHHFYGRYYYRQQDFVKFEEQLHEAVRLKEYGTFYYNLGMIELMQKKNLEGAFAYFNKAIEKGETKPDVMRNYKNLCIESGIALVKKGDFGKASARLEIALGYEPSNTAALMNLALCAVNLGDTQKAVSIWRNVALADPTIISAAKNLSIYYAGTNLRDSASFFTARYLKYRGDK